MQARSQEELEKVRRDCEAQLAVMREFYEAEMKKREGEPMKFEKLNDLASKVIVRWQEFV